jgi:MFS transporter, ACS family, glucarate transporter
MMPNAERPSRVRWLIFAVACAASWFLYLHRYSWGIIKPSFRKDHPDLSDTDIGWLDSAFAATYALGQVPSGLAADLFGPRIVLTGLILFWSGAVVGVAWVAGFWRLFGVRAAFGLAQAGGYPVLSKVTRNWFPQSSRTTIQGLVASMGRFGAASCSLILGSFLLGVLGLTWQTALVVIAIPGAVLSVAWWLIVRNHPSEHPGVNAAERELIEGGMPPASTSQRVALSLDRRSLVNLGMLLAYAFFSAFYDQLYVNWLPSFLKDRGLSDTEMGMFNMLPLLGGAFGGICGGMLNDYLIRKTGNRRWSRAGIAFSGKLLAAGLVVLSLELQDGRVAMVLLLVARFFGDWTLPTQWGTITDISGRAAGTVFGFVNAVGALGIFVAGPILGNLKQHFGWEGLFLGAAGACLIAAMSWLLIDCTRRLVSE